MSVKQVEVVQRSQKGRLHLPLLPCELWMFIKGNPDIKKILKDELNKKLRGSEIAPTNNEIKDIVKVIRSLQNRAVLIRVVYKIITTQEREFLNFLKPLMTGWLPLLKNVLTSSAKNVFVPLGLKSAAASTNAAI